jgi:hypothetical protein
MDVMKTDHEAELEKKNLTKYLLNIGQEFSLKIDRVSHLVGDNHYPSTGRYKERILKKVIEKFLPKRYEVGTGFVLFPSLLQPETVKKILKISTHEISKELDIIIYDSNNYSGASQSCKSSQKSSFPLR